ncbi:olfactory receptor 6B1-like [Rhinatrema bivittatum]|uniref:olfactory receptor 6B1-like n=1 Tax=Rhinatrema bivittatum TaxID=194408 RepID=UPI00112BF785|nr:olfactory receptor 6B1-like [Rhinatrema bivittatum]
MISWPKQNSTGVTEFIILGFPSLPEMRVILFTIFLVIYILTITANLVIIALVKTDAHLHTPMYFFLSNLSFLEISYVSTTVPKMLVSFLSVNNVISFLGCIIQLLVFSVLGATENFLLALMAYDRYLAICNPLHYTTIMNHTTCAHLVVGAWFAGLFVASLPCILVSRLTFCGPNIIDHFLCESAPLIKLACSDTSTSEIILSLSASSATLGSLVFTMGTYICIISTIIRIPSATGRQKAFSTCVSHLTVVTIFYTTVCVMYVRPSGDDPYKNKLVAVFYGIVTPFLNPFIYSLRNKDVKEACRRALKRNRALPKNTGALNVIHCKIGCWNK